MVRQCLVSSVLTACLAAQETVEVSSTQPWPYLSAQQLAAGGGVDWPVWHAAQLQGKARGSGDQFSLVEPLLDGAVAGEAL